MKKSIFTLLIAIVAMMILPSCSGTDTAEGVAKNAISALQSGNWAKYYSYFDMTEDEQAEAAQFAKDHMGTIEKGMKLKVVDVEESDGTARVTVKVSFPDGETNEMGLRLKKINDKWRITGDSL